MKKIYKFNDCIYETEHPGVETIEPPRKILNYTKEVFDLRCPSRTRGMRALLTSLVCFLTMAAPGFSQSVCRHVDLDWISSQISLPNGARVLQMKERGELCEVVLAINGGLAPIYAGKDFVLAGQLFKNGKSVTRETLDAMSDVAEKEREKLAEKKALEKEKRAAFFKKNIKALDELVALSYNPGQARDFFYVVTDPNCSHCKNLLPELEFAAQESGMEIRVIIYPLLGDSSLDLAVQAICNNYSYEAYINIKRVEPIPSCERAENLVMKTMDFFRSANLSFVPLVVAGDGSWVAEANHNTMVRAYLGLEPLGEETGPHATCNPDPEQ